MHCVSALLRSFYLVLTSAFQGERPCSQMGRCEQFSPEYLIAITANVFAHLRYAR